MRHFKIIAMALCILVSKAVVTNTGVVAQTKVLVWSDEFDYTGLPATAKWNYDVGGHGWGNNEAQYYTNARTENARVEDGHLIIEAHKESFGGNDYTSARLISLNKGDWKYGRVEVRAKLPGGRGTWPAIWLLPSDGFYGDWPKSGEIDIMEYVGYDPGIAYGSIHTEAYNHKDGTGKGGSYSVPDAESNFHDYAIEWYADRIEFFVDNNKYFTFNNEGSWEKWPFDKRFHLVLNLAIGGDWGGAEGIDNSIFPVKLEIDYVRVYQFVDNIKIEGNEFVEPGASSEVYTVPAIYDASYQWKVPEDASVTSGQGTNSISVDWGNTEDSVSVEISYDVHTYRDTFAVKLVTIPEGDSFVFNEFDDGLTDDLIAADDGANTFDFEESADELKVSYQVADASLNPHFEIMLDRPVKLSDLQVVQVRFKTHNQSGSVNARIDLVDVYGVQTNGTSVFKIEPIHSDGQYHLYEFDFNGKWISSYPNYGAKVDNNKIQRAIVYLNYGFFGTDNKTDSVWLDYIHLIKEKTLSARELIKENSLQVYPNPAGHNVFIKSAYEMESVGVVDLSGKQILIKNANSNKLIELELNNFKKGVYILQIRLSNKADAIICRKLLKSD